VAKTVFGYIKAAVRLVDDDAVLRTVATTETNVTAAGERPDYGVDEDVPAARTYRQGEPTIYEDLTSVDDDYDRGSLRSGLYVPIGDHGVFSCGESQPGVFDETDADFVAVLTTIAATALSRIHSEAQIRSQNERLEEFASVVSHDLRNPLHVAESRLELAREDCESEHLAPIGCALDRMRVLIDDLLTLAREGESATDPEPIALAEIVESCWTTVDTAAATLDVASDRTISADRSRLRQLFENLFRNAVEHGGGDVTVSVGDLPDGFYVADDGPGIPETDREVVFEAGYSTSPDGTGFGLAIVEQVAQAHGWSVRVTAAPDGGTRFEITGVEFPG
jgi:signal transduction histidine kinase